MFILSSILSAVAMYLLCRKLFDRKAAILAVFLYTYAPYRAVDIYVRGSLSESFAFIFFPLIFYASLLLSERKNLTRVCLLALSLTGLFLTHNITTLMFLPFLVIFWIYLIIAKGAWKLIFPFVSSLALGSGVSAFFLLPAMFERQLIQTQYLIVGYFNFRAHFVALSQFFSTFWGYGVSQWGYNDGLSFQVGVVNWAVFVLALVLGFFLINFRGLKSRGFFSKFTSASQFNAAEDYNLLRLHPRPKERDFGEAVIKNKHNFAVNKKSLIFLLILGISFLLSLFLQHNKSAFIWEAIPLMAFVQFPW
ncbi:YfhO family protein, partial [Patescibacteria group bacterium]|nr:YfhO family protein [Patescibacteria group bacterium]